MAVIGNQGGGGIIYDSPVNTTVVAGFSPTSYTVPNGKYFQGVLGVFKGTSGNQTYANCLINGAEVLRATASVGVTAAESTGGITLGDGAVITCQANGDFGGSGTVTIAGSLQINA